MKRNFSIALAALVVLSVATAQAEPVWKRIQKSIKSNESSAAPQEHATTDVAAVAQSTALDSSQAPVARSPKIGLPMATDSRRGSKGQINLGKEADEKGAARDLFTNPEVLRMLGQNPRFIYTAESLSDPMVFPPVRNAAIYAELTIQAESFITEEKPRDAIKSYRKILALNDSRFIVEAREKINDLNAQIGAEMTALTEGDELNLNLPSWVRDNTNGILYAKDSPMCLVGDYLLGIGDFVPNHPAVKVAEIHKEKVIFQISDRNFDVEVKGYEVW